VFSPSSALHSAPIERRPFGHTLTLPAVRRLDVLPDRA